MISRIAVKWESRHLNDVCLVIQSCFAAAYNLKCNNIELALLCEVCTLARICEVKCIPALFVAEIIKYSNACCIKNRIICFNNVKFCLVKVNFKLSIHQPSVCLDIADKCKCIAYIISFTVNCESFFSRLSCRSCLVLYRTLISDDSAVFIVDNNHCKVIFTFRASLKIVRFHIYNFNAICQSCFTCADYFKLKIIQSLASCKISSGQWL